MSPEWLDTAVSEFGETCKAKLAGPGDPEAAIRAPLEALLAAAGNALGLKVVPHDEVRDTERGVRPDYAISVGGLITGYVEVKRPGANLDPASFTGHNRRQWERQRDLPNLIYTNGTEWRLWKDLEQVGDPAHLTGGTLTTAGASLAPGDKLELLLTDFLRWRPATITSVGRLVKAIAPLTRLLRGEVLDQLAVEERAIRAGAPEAGQPFRGLARDWRRLLFPTADDKTFADGYAQTVTFALLLARTEGIDLSGVESLHDVGQALSGQHSLMARALQLLTDYVERDFAVTLKLLVRVVGAVDWPKVRKGKRDTYLHLYESFLDEYDPALRHASGSYYTPREVVDEMVRLTEDVLTTRLGRSGFADEGVVTVDPAMGTGTYLHTIIERVAEATRAGDGAGAVPAAITDLARQLYGFELQMGPFAVAELRASDLMTDLGAPLPERGLGLYVTNTLDDPYAEQAQLGSGLELISRSMRLANKVKARANVTVVIGNPPYKERAEGMGGWIENGTIEQGANRTASPLDAFRAEGNGRTEYVLKNLYVYFWRWATWKVFDANREIPDGDAGVVCFISTSGYLRGPGFKGMREYLRRTAAEGWIIDVTPEGQRPDVPTRIFPGVQQPLAIGIFVRRADTDRETPAELHYRQIHGRRADKFQALAGIGLDDDGWRAVRTAWTAPFTPAADSDWDDYPALNDLMPWTQPGVKANRTWVYAPDRDILGDRWTALRVADENRADLFKASRDSALDRGKAPLPGTDTAQTTEASLDQAFPAKQTMVRVGYRSFDRQWIIADSRVIDQPRPPLWSARIPGQVYVIEQHAHEFADGPALQFSALIPDMDSFNGRGGRALPLLHPSGEPNLAAGLTAALSADLDIDVTADDAIAYIAAVVAHPGFTDRFTDELTTPGIRVPITADPALWRRAVVLGQTVIWLHTYGAAFADPAAGRPDGDIRLPVGDSDRISNLTAITGMPETIGYDPEAHVVTLGTGTFGPVLAAVWEYTVGGRNVVKSWFNYRKKTPGGKKTSPLDHLHVDAWPSEWNGELIDLLTVLTRLVALEEGQRALLGEILAGPIQGHDKLTASGVTWPTGGNDLQRRPRYKESAPRSQQLGLEL